MPKKDGIHCRYCGVDVRATSWATSVEDHEYSCGFLEIKRLTSEKDLYLETLRRLKRIDTEMCLLVTQMLREVWDEKGQA